MDNIASGARAIWHIVVKYWWVGVAVVAAFFWLLLRYDEQDEITKSAKGWKEDCDKKVRDAESKARVEMIKIEEKSQEKKEELRVIKKVDDADERLDKLVEFLRREYDTND